MDAWLPDIDVLMWSAGLRVCNYALHRWNRTAKAETSATLGRLLWVTGIVGFLVSLLSIIGYWWLTDWRRVAGLIVIRFVVTLPGTLWIPDREAIWLIAMVASWPLSVGLVLAVF